MTVVVAIFGALVAAVGLAGMLRPQRLIEWLGSFWTRDRLWLAVVLRLVFGTLLVVAAPGCRFPAVVGILGVITIVSGFGLLVVGRERMMAFVRWWAERPSGVIRAWASGAVAFGAFLVYAGA